MTNILPSMLNQLFPLADNAAGGLHSLAGTIGIAHNTEARVRADLAAARAAEQAHQEAMSARLAATAAQTEIAKQAREFLYTACDIFKGTLGRSYSQAWRIAGFHNNTLELPSTFGARKELVKSIEQYLVAYPNMEVPAANVTSTFASGLYDGLSSAKMAQSSA